jgi:hypothetical protein
MTMSTRLVAGNGYGDVPRGVDTLQRPEIIGAAGRSGVGSFTKLFLGDL